MKTFLVFLMLTGLVVANGTPDSPQIGTPSGIVAIDREPLPPPSNPVPAWNYLLTMPAENRANSLIELELESSASETALETSQAIESLWNQGRCDEAIGLFDELAKQTDIRGLAIGNSWRVPVPTQETALWGTDIRIGNRDSLAIVALDIHRASGNLFAVLAGPKDGRSNWYVNFSTDNGNTWSETYIWVSGIGEQLNSMSAAVVANHCFVAYTALNPQTEARIRRFRADTGVQENFSDGSGWIVVDQTVDPEYIREVSFSTNQEAFNNRIYYMLITSTGSLRFFWDVASDGTTWSEESPIMTNADRGLDATFNQGYASRFFFVSYFDADDNVRVLGHDAGAWYNLLQIPSGNVTSYTAISAYGDTVICVYDRYDTDIFCEYRISRDAGESWSIGYLDSLSLRSESADVTAELGAGLAVTYRYYTDPREERFAYRGYDPGPWPTRAVFSDEAPYWNKPSIEYLGAGTYGVVYLSWSTPYTRAAYFDLGTTAGCPYILGDINGNGTANGIDVGYGVNYFKGGAVPPISCPSCAEPAPFYAAGDVNGNCAFNGIDISFFVNYFKGGTGLSSCSDCPPAGRMEPPASIVLPELPESQKISGQPESGDF